MAADDVKRIAEILANRTSRIRVDGGDPRTSSPSIPNFIGYAYPTDSPRAHTAWVMPISVTPIKTNNCHLRAIIMMAFPRTDIETVYMNLIYIMQSPTNPFGLFNSLRRHTYEGLHNEVGGAAFANPDRDTYTLGPRPNVAGQRKFSVNIIDQDINDDILVDDGNPLIHVATGIEVQIPIE